MSRPKILYMELLNNNYGNKRLDMEFIKCLCAFADVMVACPKGWFTEIDKRARLYEYDQIEVDCSKKNRVISHLYDLKMGYEKIEIAIELDKKEHFDYLFFASFNIVIMRFCYKRFPNYEKRVFITHHDSVDRIQRHNLYKVLFNKYKKKINHIVLEKFIKEFLVTGHNIDENKVFMIPHPLNRIKEDVIKEYDMVGISNSNDESIINSFVEEENSTGFFKDNNLKVMLRSKLQTYDDGYLTVIRGYLEDETYYKYVTSAKTLLVPFPLSFQYRMSGTVIDAFSNNTKVVGSGIPLLKQYEKEYPELCCTFDSTNEIFAFLLNDFEGKELIEQFDEFKRVHSNEWIQKCFENIFIAE